jgi:hypothetical protein
MVEIILREEVRQADATIRLVPTRRKAAQAQTET